MPLMLTERTLFFHDIISSTEKPSGLLNMKSWTTGVAKTRECSLTFGPGTRDMSSVANPHSRATSVSSTTTRTSSMTTASHASHGPQSEGESIVTRMFGGLEDEKDSLEELQSVLGKRGASAVCVSILAAVTC